METLIPIKLKPGLYRNGTVYEAAKRWYAANLIRWHEGTIRPIGGWTQNVDTNSLPIQGVGKPRATLAWRKNDQTPWLALGTTGTPSKLYAFSGATLNDITPSLTNGIVDGSTSTGTGNYGAGAYGMGPYGGALGAAVTGDADTWSLDNFGEILLACLTSDGKIWESTPAAVATQVTNSPTACRAVCVTPERFVFALGASGDPRNVAWCAQSNRTVWTPSSSNSAGSFTLQSSGRLLAGRRTDRETILWTDTDLWVANYVGGNLIYAFQRRGSNCGLIGPNAYTIAEGAAFWMSDGQFFVYDGAVRPLPCDISDHVFGDLNRVQRAKICAWSNVPYGEVWFHYPSASQSGLENDRVAVLNYRTGSWMTHTLARNAAASADVFSQPQLWDSVARLYSHEIAMYHDGVSAYIETGPLELQNGDRTLRLQRLIPDERSLGQVEAKFYTTFQPMAAERLSDAYSLQATTSIRETGRQFRLRLEEPAIGVVTADAMYVSADTTSLTADGSIPSGHDFRIGDFRIGVVPGGYR